MTMAFLHLPIIFLLIHPYGNAIVYATTSFNLYTDNACESLYGTVQTDTCAGNGNCGYVNGVNSASSVTLDPDCYGI